MPPPVIPAPRRGLYWNFAYPMPHGLPRFLASSPIGGQARVSSSAHFSFSLAQPLLLCPPSLRPEPPPLLCASLPPPLPSPTLLALPRPSSSSPAGLWFGFSSGSHRGPPPARLRLCRFSPFELARRHHREERADGIKPR